MLLPVALKRVAANDLAEPATSADSANFVKDGRIICLGTAREDDNTPSVERTLQHIPYPLCQRIARDVLCLVNLPGFLKFEVCGG